MSDIEYCMGEWVPWSEDKFCHPDHGQCVHCELARILVENESLRKALKLAKPCVDRDMNAAVKNNFGFVDNDPWACSAVDARDAIVDALNRSPENHS